ncbi:hypothetical protein [Candidatus Bandiella euplotis]|uniref:Uncharacterized protein n=1 Tax=Candidatus Bandiella euplotis TaxID=1664265 RepID=A0ABZ0ULQ4_9RICK|nr:hypothetical protein [Candidatus Bandiella woodruffii]WPX96664.1 hypothetical protein Bandiella_00784 [Candidatus Bandiella woodruffii]
MRHRLYGGVRGRFSNGSLYSISKSEEVVDLTIKLWLHFEDNNNFLSEQGNFISIFG